MHFYRQTCIYLLYPGTKYSTHFENQKFNKKEKNKIRDREHSVTAKEEEGGKEEANRHFLRDKMIEFHFVLPGRNAPLYDNELHLHYHF